MRDLGEFLKGYRIPRVVQEDTFIWSYTLLGEFFIGSA